MISRGPFLGWQTRQRKVFVGITTKKMERYVRVLGLAKITEKSHRNTSKHLILIGHLLSKVNPTRGPLVE